MIQGNWQLLHESQPCNQQKQHQTSAEFYVKSTVASFLEINMYEMHHISESNVASARPLPEPERAEQEVVRQVLYCL